MGFGNRRQEGLGPTIGRKGGYREGKKIIVLILGVLLLCFGLLAHIRVQDIGWLPSFVRQL